MINTSGWFREFIHSPATETTAGSVFRPQEPQALARVGSIFLHDAQASHASRPFFSQLRALANSRLALRLPMPSGPIKRYEPPASFFSIIPRNNLTAVSW